MNITIDNAQFRCEFRYHAEIIARLKLIPGATWDKVAKAWFVPLQQGDRLLRTFPKASFSYDALCACWDAEMARTRIFAAGLARLGVQLAIDAHGAVCAVGEGVSPELQRIVSERSDDLRAWVDVAMPVVEVTETDMRRGVPVEVTHGDRLIHAGMQNAANREAEQRERARAYRRRALEQAELFGEERRNG